jgi:hypothetical protein
MIYVCKQKNLAVLEAKVSAVPLYLNHIKHCSSLKSRNAGSGQVYSFSFRLALGGEFLSGPQSALHQPAALWYFGIRYTCPVIALEFYYLLS